MSREMKLRHSGSTVFFDLRDRWTFSNRLLSIVLMMLTMTVSVPLSIKTYEQGGGPWGFGIVGLHILLPLNTYVLFAISALLNNKAFQWLTFVSAQVLSLCVGLAGFMVFPILPKSILLIPASLAFVSVINRRRLAFFLCVMLVLGVSANVMLLKWELDFGRTVPIIQLFEPVLTPEP